jgi:hypothetical protein
MRKKLLFYGSLCLFFVLVLGLSIFPIYQGITENNYYPGSCQTSLLNTSNKFTKTTDMWHTSYFNGDYKIINGCASGEMFVTYKDMIIGGTSNRAYQKGHMDVYNCNKETIFRLSIVNDIRYLLFENDTYYSLIIHYPNNTNAGYVKSADLYINNFMIFEYLTDAPIINIKNGTELVVIKNTSLLVDSLLLSSIIGYLQISSRKNNIIAQADNCEMLFYSCIIIAVSIFIGLILLILYKVLSRCKMCKKREDDFELVRLGGFRRHNGIN